MRARYLAGAAKLSEPLQIIGGVSGWHIKRQQEDPYQKRCWIPTVTPVWFVPNPASSRDKLTSWLFLPRT